MGVRALLSLSLLLGLSAPGFAQAPAPASDFVTLAATANLFEIATGKLAQEKASANAVNLATGLAKDHGDILTELKALTESGKVKAKIPDAMDAAHQAKLDKLQTLKGGAFDKSYLEIQVAEQQNYVASFERYAASGDIDSLKALASKYLPRLKQHLKAVKDTREILLDE